MTTYTVLYSIRHNHYYILNGWIPDYWYQGVEIYNGDIIINFIVFNPITKQIDITIDYWLYRQLLLLDIYSGKREWKGEY